METRKHPVIIVQCPKCDAVFASSVIEEEHPFDHDFHNKLCWYAREGYKITVVNSDEYPIRPCGCHMASFYESVRKKYSDEGK